jgi:hypothetical protein
MLVNSGITTKIATSTTTAAPAVLICTYAWAVCVVQMKSDERALKEVAVEYH